MAKKKETEPKGTDKKNEKINGEKTDNVEIEVEKEVFVLFWKRHGAKIKLICH